MDRKINVKKSKNPWKLRSQVISLRLSLGHVNRPFRYSTKEPGSSDIFIHFIHEARLSGVGASISIVHIRKFYRM